MTNKKKAKLLPHDEVLQVASQIDLEMRHLFSKGSYTTPALLNAAVAVSRMHGERRAAASSRGGAAAAKTSKAEAASWQAECVTKARALLAQGKSARELGGILAKQLNKSTRQISNVLKKAEVK